MPFSTLNLQNNQPDRFIPARVQSAQVQRNRKHCLNRSICRLHLPVHLDVHMLVGLECLDLIIGELDTGAPAPGQCMVLLTVGLDSTKQTKSNSRKAPDEFVLMFDGPAAADGRLLNPEETGQVCQCGILKRGCKARLS